MDFDVSAQVDALAKLPPEPPKPPTRSAWTVVPRAITGGAGRLGAAIVEGVASISPTEEELRRNPGRVAFSTEDLGLVAQSARDFERTLRPDPLTAGIAEQVIYSLGAALTQAGAGALVGGPFGAAAAIGGGEGAAATDDLQRQGVDDTTARQAGAVTGVVGAASVALPLFGPTLKATAGLYLAGGPGGFMAQQALTSQILERAGYDKIAEQFDPLDPLGLALSGLIPLPFAGYGAARNIRAARAQKAVDAAPLSNLEPAALPPKTEIPTVSPEAVDAAMVHNLTLLRDGQTAAQAEAARVAAIPPMDLFHGTKADITVEGLSKTDDLGPHFTTARATAELFANGEGTPGRVLEAEGIFAKPLDLPDLNSWFPTDVAQAIDGVRGAVAGADGQTPLQAKVWAAMQKAKNEYLDALPNDLQQQRGNFGNPSAEMKQAVDAAIEKGRQAGYELLRAELRGEGYDSIRYKNANEGDPVDTYISLDSSRVRSKGSPARPDDAADPRPTTPAAPKLAPLADTIESLAKSPDPAIRAIAEGLRMAGKDIERLQAAAPRGEPSTDYSKALDTAAKEIDAQRTSGQSLVEFLDARADTPPTLNNLLIGLSESASSPKRVASLVRELADAAEKARTATEPKTPGDLTADAVEGMRALTDDQLTGTEPSTTAATTEPHMQSVSDRVAAVEIANPDMVVGLDASGNPITVADEIARIRKEAFEGTDTELGAADAGLVKVAANCALSVGQ